MLFFHPVNEIPDIFKVQRFQAKAQGFSWELGKVDYFWFWNLEDQFAIGVYGEGDKSHHHQKQDWDYAQ